MDARPAQPQPPQAAPPILGEAELTEADFLHAWAAAPQIRRVKKLYLVMLTFSGLLLLVNLQTEAPLWAALFPLFMVGAIGSAVIFSTRRAWAKRAALDHAAGRVRFRFDDTGLSSESALRDHQFRWAALPQHIEAEESFLVYTGSQAIMVIPKRAFAAGDLPALRELLLQRIPPKPSKSSLPRLIGIWLVLVVMFLSVWHFLSIDRARELEEPDQQMRDEGRRQ